MLDLDLTFVIIKSMLEMNCTELIVATVTLCDEAERLELWDVCNVVTAL